MSSSQYLRRPILILREGVVASQGKPQIISNINACQSLVDIMESTLGPFGMDKLFCSERSEMTITNDGATIVNLLNLTHPAARILLDISKSQDSEEGDGTTSVIVFAGSLLTEAKKLLNEGLTPQIIVKEYRGACLQAVQYLNKIQIDVSKELESDDSELLMNCARTSLNSKVISSHRDQFAKIVLDVVRKMPNQYFNRALIGIKKVKGGSVEPKKITCPKIALLNIELELKAEKDNAEVRVSSPAEYQAVVDAEWKIIFDKLDAIVASGSQVVLSRLPIGDLATQYFADHDIFCAGRVDEADMTRTAMATGGKVQSTISGLSSDVLGTCGVFEEIQIGSERYNVFKDCFKAQSTTIILRGGGHQVLEEAERSLNDAIMTVHRVIKSKTVVPGGGAIDMRLSLYIREKSLQWNGKEQLIWQSFAKALERIPRTLAVNCCLDQIDIMNRLREMNHLSDFEADRDPKKSPWFGIDAEQGCVGPVLERSILESASVKKNILAAATEAASLILSVDETIKNPKSASPETAAQQAVMRQNA